MTDRELMQHALEAMEFHTCGDEIDEALITALRERLARDDALDRMAENARELGLDLIAQDKLFVSGQMGAHVTRVTVEPARQEQGPVAVPQFRKRGCSDWYDGRADHQDGCGPYEERILYTAPHPAQQPLTDEQIEDAVREADLDWHQGWTLNEDAPNRFTALARAVEQAHGITGGKK